MLSTRITDMMKITPERYGLIPKLPEKGKFFQHFPGVYCQNCGKDFALYHYSLHQPDGLDENGIPFYTKCVLCRRQESNAFSYDEFKAWMRAAKKVDQGPKEYDSSGNCDTWVIYEVGDKLYQVELQNDEPYDDSSLRVNGEKRLYTLQQVEKKVRWVEEVTYDLLPD